MIITKSHPALGEVTYHLMREDENKKPLHVLTVRIGDYGHRKADTYLSSDQHNTFVSELTSQYC